MFARQSLENIPGNTFDWEGEYLDNFESEGKSSTTLNDLNRQLHQITTREKPNLYIYRSVINNSAGLASSAEKWLFLRTVLNEVEKLKGEEMDYLKGEIYSYLANFAGNMHSPDQGLSFLYLMLESIRKMTDEEGDRAVVLAAMADAAGTMNAPVKSLDFLKILKNEAEKLKSDYSDDRKFLYSGIAKAAGKIDPADVSFDFLRRLKMDIDKLPANTRNFSDYETNDDSLGHVYCLLTASMCKRAPKGNIDFLYQLQQSALNIGNDNDKDHVLASIVRYSAQIKMSDREQMIKFLSTVEGNALASSSMSLQKVYLLYYLSVHFADLGEFRKAYNLANLIDEKYAQKVFALIHVRKKYNQK